MAVLSLVAAVVAVQGAVQLAPLDRPFLFAYGSWTGQASVSGGVARLRGTPRGGAGVQFEADLSAKLDWSPMLRVKVLRPTSMKFVQLLLVDRADRSGRFEFPLPASGEGLVLPRDGAPFSRPNVAEKGPLDLGRITQWQLGGDWSSDEPIDLEVSALMMEPPNSEILALRRAREDADRAEEERRRAERLELRDRYGARTERSPRWVQTSFLGPDMIGIEAVAGRVERGSIRPYDPLEGDQRRVDGRKVLLARGGRDVGYLIGRKRDQLRTMESFSGDPLLDEFAGDPGQYTVTSPDDPAFAVPVHPTAVYRKTKPIDAAMPSYEMVLRHRLYLALPKPLSAGKKYSVRVGLLNVVPSESEVVFDPMKTWSEAVRVSQIGFRPDDPLKRAYLSVWLGTGGARSYPVGTRFYVVDDKTGKKAFEGRTTLGLAADGKETLFLKEANHSKTAIYRMDFAGLEKPGVYRVVVDGVGASDRFPIARDAWTRALKTQMRGLYHNRSGISLGPPYTRFVKPRDFHPADGESVTQSRYCALDGGGESPELARMDTGEPVPGAWGGYQDAGDWNPRRATHLRATLAHLELMRLFPKSFERLRWNIPPDVRAPDTLVEALFELSLFRRLQKPDGGVPYGIETDGDPIEGEVSWLQSMKAYVYAPDPVSSWVYAAAAGLFSDLMRPYQPKLAADYRASAIRAMEWAESNRQRFGSKIDWTGNDWRNLAAVRLFAATADERWHRTFLEGTVLKQAEPRLFAWTVAAQSEAAFVYATLPAALGDPALKAKAVAGIEAEARKALDYASHNGWNLTTSDPGKPMFLGFFSSPNGEDLVRAHYLTGKREYLAGAIQSSLFCGGANPSGVAYTSGIGVRSAMPFKIDYRATGQDVPEGLTIFGNCDFVGWPTNGFFNWPIQWHVSRVAIPNVYEWPIPEALFETFLYPGQLEYTVDAWSPNILVWGYLSARK